MGRIQQIVDDSRLVAGAVEGHFYRQHLRISTGLAEKALDSRCEGLVWVLQKNRPLLPDEMKYVVRAQNPGVVHRVVRRCLQIRAIQAGYLEKISFLKQAIGFDNIFFLVQPEFCRQHPPVHRGHSPGNFQTNNRRELSIA